VRSLMITGALFLLPPIFYCHNRDKDIIPV
jgi:hypothetical protein